MLSAFTKRTAVVTGAASGIGFGLARRCHERGMNVAMLDVEGEALSGAAAHIGGSDRIVPLVVDMADAAAVEAAASTVAERFGSVHLMCNNAGVSIAGRLWAMTEQDFRWVIGVNIVGVQNGIRAFLPKMLQSGEEGHLVSTSSLAGLTPMPNAGLYSATKAAVVAMSEVLFHDLRKLEAKVGVSVLCPGLVNTNILLSERNRPAELSVTGGDGLNEAVLAYFKTGDDPLDVADLVLNAVERDDFYILTTEASLPDLRDRNDAIARLDHPPRPRPESITPARAMGNPAD
jgi:NADP-dependent 3-hydroxy acid dehydrogenase YdfG